MNYTIGFNYGKAAKLTVRGALLIGIGLLLGVRGVWAEPLSANVVQQIASISAEKASRTPEELRIDSQLLYAYRADRGIAPAPGVPARAPLPFGSACATTARWLRRSRAGHLAGT